MTGSPIDYYFSLNSPWSYLGVGRLAAIAEAAGRLVKVFPVQSMEVFSRTGGLPLAKRAPERQNYRLAELNRWREFLDIKLTLEPKFFPADDSFASHAVIAADEKGLNALKLVQEIGRAQWELEEDFSQPDVAAAAAERAGIDMRSLGELRQYEARYKANAELAVAKGVFGYPFYIVDGESYWGQDRLDFVARKLGVETGA